MQGSGRFSEEDFSSAGSVGKIRKRWGRSGFENKRRLYLFPRIRRCIDEVWNFCNDKTHSHVQHSWSGIWPKCTLARTRQSVCCPQIFNRPNQECHAFLLRLNYQRLILDLNRLPCSRHLNFPMSPLPWVDRMSLPFPDPPFLNFPMSPRPWVDRMCRPFLDPPFFQTRSCVCHRPKRHVFRKQRCLLPGCLCYFT